MACMTQTTSRVLSLICVLLAAMLLGGCSSPPDQEMQSAQDAVSQAREMGAEEYVPEQFRALADSLNAAMAEKQEQDEKFALFRSYGDAKMKFEKVQQMAGEVNKKADAQREMVKQEVMAMVDNVGQMVEQAKTALSKAPKGKDNKAELELIKNELNGLAASYEEARADIENGEFGSAKAKLDSVLEGTQRIIDEITAARGGR